jgi:hypothetical protein
MATTSLQQLFARTIDDRQARLGDKLTRFVEQNGTEIAALEQRLLQGDQTALRDLARRANLTPAESADFIELATQWMTSHRAEIEQSAVGQAMRDGGGKVNQTRADGATAGAYLAKDKVAVRKSKAELEGDVAALNAAWPKDAPQGVDPPAFVAKADELDAYKQARFQSLGPKPATLAVTQVVDEANVIHGKRGHTQNLVGMIGAFLGDAEVRGAVEKLLDGKSVRALDDDLRAAAPFLNLADLTIPTRLLAAKRRLTPEETEQYIANRTVVSAAMHFSLFNDLNLKVLIADTRPAEPKARAIGPQLLQLLDDVAAMAAKPFFQNEGKVDPIKLGKAIVENAVKAGINAELAAAIAGAIARGVADRGLEHARKEDLFVR